MDINQITIGQTYPGPRGSTRIVVAIHRLDNGTPYVIDYQLGSENTHGKKAMFAQNFADDVAEANGQKRVITKERPNQGDGPILRSRHKSVTCPKCKGNVALIDAEVACGMARCTNLECWCRFDLQTREVESIPGGIRVVKWSVGMHQKIKIDRMLASLDQLHATERTVW